MSSTREALPPLSVTSRDPVELTGPVIAAFALRSNSPVFSVMVFAVAKAVESNVMLAGMTGAAPLARLIAWRRESLPAGTAEPSEAVLTTKLNWLAGPPLF